MVKDIQFPFPVFIMKEGKWFVAECPIFNIATQGKTEVEVKKNMKDLIEECLADPDISKSSLKNTNSSFFTYIPVSLSQKISL